MKFGHATLVILGVLALAGGSLAQDRKPITLEEKRRMIVSARAGEINLVEGDVSMKAAQDWALLVPGDVVKDGDIVKTGPGSRAEVLLNPGSYLRLSENTEFKFDNTSIDSIKINLLKGSAIVEAAAGEGSARVLATVVTPKGQFSIVGSGIYRFDVEGSGRTEARVAKGRLTTGTVDVREGNQATIGDAGPELVAFDKKSADTFDAWSKDRAKSLVAANNNLTRTNVNLLQAGFLAPFGSSGFFTPFGSSFGSRWFGSCGGWWYFDPFFGSFIYIPNGFGLCSPFFSPYGYDYQACYYPPSRGYVEEPGENEGKKAGKHPRVPKQPGGPLPAGTFRNGQQRPTLGADRGGNLGSHHPSNSSAYNHGTAEGRPTIGHSSPTYSGGNASGAGHSGGGSFSSSGHNPSYGGGSSSGGHVSTASAPAASSPAPATSSSSSSGGGGHHSKN